METIPYEILIRGENGKLSGCHVIVTPGADARPITPADIAAIAPSINAAAIARNEVLGAEHADALSAAEFKYTTDVSKLNDQLDAANARIAAAVVAKEKLLAAAKDPDIDANIVIGGIIAEAEATETEKRRSALAAEIAAKQAELESLES